VLTSLLETKLYFPSVRPALVSRPRLVERLQAGLRGPLTLVSAPAGSGKTTLLSEWRAGPGTHCPVAWLSLDAADNDPLRFLQYLSAALDTIQPGIAQEIHPLLQAADKPNTEAILTLLMNTLGGFPQDFALVLDDYHSIETLAIHEALTFLLDHLPPRMHIVLLTRSDPVLPLARLRARGQLTEIRVEHLRFNSEETAQFLNQIMDLDLTPEQVAALKKRTEGWIAGLQLAALSMQGRRDPDGFISVFTGSNHYILDYLVEEVLDRQQEKVREFLLKTSLLERLTGPLCEAVTDQPGGGETLVQLEHANLFVIPLDYEQRWYRYHHLFSDLLRNRLRHFHPELLNSLHNKAAEWYEKNGLFFDAMNHLLAAGEFEHACNLLGDNAHTILREHVLLDLVRWIKAIPDTIVRSNPRVCLLFGYGKESLGDINAYISYVESAEKELSRLVDRVPPGSTEDATLLAEIKVNQIDIAIRRGNLEAALSLADEAIALAPVNDHFVRSQAYLYAGWARRDLGQFEDAIPFCERALSEARLANQPGLTATSISLIGGMLNALGYLQHSMRVFQDGLQYALEEKQARLPIYANIHYELAKIYWELNNLDQAEEQMEQGRILSVQGGRPLETIEGYVVEALLRIARGDESGTLEILEKAFLEERRTGIQILHDELTYYRVKILAGEENTGEALEWLKGREYLLRGKYSYQECTNSLRSGHLLVELGRLDEALELLPRILAVTEARHFVGWQIETLVLLACATYLKGDLAQALDLIKGALTLAEPQGYIRVFLEEGRLMLELLRLAKKKGIAPDYIGKLLSGADKKASPELPGQYTSSHLSKRELELLTLIASGCSNKEIAAELVISVATVKRHTTNIFNKLDAKNRTEAVARARELGMM
jgi:LuxR family transcriptional regulator, maltose regulon positive regulatory protein